MTPPLNNEMRPDELQGGNHLLVDAAGPLVQTGLWRDGKWIAWTGSREEAGRSLFAGVEAIFREQDISLHELNGFLFCEGPGSMLGIRMAAMAIRGWQALLDTPLPVFTYNSHDLLARVLLARDTPVPFHVISDARRKRWNVTSVTARGEIEPLRRVAPEELGALTGSFYRMEETLRAEPPIAAVEIIPYALEHEAERFLDSTLLRKTATPDALSLETPEYQKWNAQRHR